MTVQEIKMLFAFNAWATNRVFDTLMQFPRDLYEKDLHGSHGGIRGTMAHLVGAEKIWLSRWINKPEMTGLTQEDVLTLASLKQLWEKVASGAARFTSRLDDRKLLSTFEYTTLDGKKYASSYQQTLLHLVNHSTYHRGQIATLMRQVGAQPCGTDLITFYRHTEQPSPKQEAR